MRKYRYAEKCLWDYKKNIARLNALLSETKELMAASDIHVQDYQGRRRNFL